MKNMTERIIIQEFQGTRAMKMRLTSTKIKIKIIQTLSHISKTKKESSDEEGGSTDERETYQMKEKGTNRQGERKYDNYSQNDSQNESKLTER